MDTADTGPIIVAMAILDTGRIIVDMAIMIMAMDMMTILRSYISNGKMTHKEQKNHKLTIGIIVVIQKDITQMSKNVLKAGCQLLHCHLLYQTHQKKSQLLQLHQLHQSHNKDLSC